MCFEQECMCECQQQGDNFDLCVFESIENKMVVFDQLIDEQVVCLVGEQVGVVIGDGVVCEYIVIMLVFFDLNGKFNENNYCLVLVGGNLLCILIQFQELVCESLQQLVILLGLQSFGFVIQVEIECLLKLLGEICDVELVVLLFVLVDIVLVIDDQIKKWYDSYGKDFCQVESVLLEYVEINGVNLLVLILVDEVILCKCYEEEKVKFILLEQCQVLYILIIGDGVEVKVNKIVVDVKVVGVDFVVLVKVNLEDLGFKDQGGDLGWVECGVMVKLFEDVLFVVKVGDVIGLVKIEFGYYIIKVVVVCGGQGKLFEEVCDMLVVEQLKVDGECGFNELVGCLVDVINKSLSDLVVVVKEVNLLLQMLGLIICVIVSGIVVDLVVLCVVFFDVLVQDGIVSDLIVLGGVINYSVVICVVVYILEQVLLLDKVCEQVIVVICVDCQCQVSDKVVEVILVKLKVGVILQLLVVSEKLQLSLMLGLLCSQLVLILEINCVIFSVLVLVEGKLSYGKVDVNGYVLLFVVNKVNLGDIKEVIVEQQKQLKEQLSQIDGMVVVKVYIEVMCKKFMIQIIEVNL